MQTYNKVKEEDLTHSNSLKELEKFKVACGREIIDVSPQTECEATNK